MTRQKTWRSGPPSRSPGYEALHQMYVAEQLNYKEIARRHGVSAVTVMRWLRAVGIPARSISEATSLAMRDWKPTEEHKEKLRETIRQASASRTPESFAKIGAAAKGRVPANKGVPWTDEQRAKHMATRQTDEYRAKQSELRKGEKSNFWRGGQTDAETLRMNGWEWKKRRAECYERDLWTCRDCGCKCLGKSDSHRHPKRRIQCHHIVRRRDGGGDELENLVTLCLSCHHKREAKGAAALFA